MNGSTNDLLVAEVQPWLNGVRRVTVDLECVTFMDSDGVEALLAVDSQLKQHGHRLVLRNPSLSASRSLALFGLEDRFEFERDDETTLRGQ